MIKIGKKSFVSFKNEEDQSVCIDPDAITKVIELESVVDVYTLDGGKERLKVSPTQFWGILRNLA